MKKIFIILLVLFAGSIFAETFPSGNSVCTTIRYENGTEAINMSDPACAQTLEYKSKMCEGTSIFSSNIAECTGNTVLIGIFGIISGAIGWLLNLIYPLLFYSPDITSMTENYGKVLKIVQSLFSVLIAFLGLYWIWGAKSVEGRLKAKEWTEKLILLLIAESMGLFIFGMALKLNNYIAEGILGGVSQQTFSIGGTVGAAAIGIIVYAAGIPVLLLTVATLILRNIIIMIMLVLFPFTLMLYLTPPTRQWGIMAVNLTGVIIFLGAIDSLIIYGASSITAMQGMLSIDPIIQTVASLGVFALIGMFNVWLVMNSAHMGSMAVTMIRSSTGGGQSIVENTRTTVIKVPEGAAETSKGWKTTDYK